MNESKPISHPHPAQHPALVLGLFDTGVAVASLLLKRGIHVIGAGHLSREVGAHGSRWQYLPLPNPSIERAATLKKLLELGQTLAKPAVVFPSSDLWVDFVTAHAEELSTFFLLNVPTRRTTSALLHKESQLLLAEKAGILVPKTCALSELTDWEQRVANLRFPLFVKGTESGPWQARFPTKGFVANNTSELRTILHKTVAQGIPVVCQEIIEGPITNNIEVSGYVDSHGLLYPLFCVQKVRQFPPFFGAGTRVISASHPELEKDSAQFLAAAAIRGMANIEFKIDERNGKAYYIETNIRPWQQVEMAAVAGCDLVWAQYLDLTGAEVNPADFVPRRKVAWVDPLLDLQSLLRQPDFRWQQIISWIREVTSAQVWSVFSSGGFISSCRKLGWGRQFLSLARGVLSRALGTTTFERSTLR